jgi:hypothetical protein
MRSLSMASSGRDNPPLAGDSTRLAVVATMLKQFNFRYEPEHDHAASPASEFH